MSKRYLTKELTRILLLATISIFIIGQIILFLFNYQDAKRGLNNRVYNILQSANVVLKEALWDYDEDQINSIIQSLLGHEDIVSVTVIDDVSNKKFGAHIVEYNQFEDPSIQMDIVRDNNFIGTVRAYYTLQYFYAEHQKKLISQLLILVALSFVITYIVNYYTKKVVDPISQIVEHAEDIKGNLYETLKIESDSKEIITLVDAINYMKTSILKHTIELEEVNNTLELRVEERTRELQENNLVLNQTIDLLKEAEMELMRASKLEVTQQLVSGIAHEINTPLGNAITLISYIPKNLQLLKNNVDFPIGETTEMNLIEDALLHIDESLQQVVEMVSKFRSLDFRSTGSMSKSINLKELVNNTLILITEENKCNLIVDFLLENEVQLNTKPFILMEVIKQLIENTCYHAYEKDEEKKLRISCDNHEKSITIYFEDFGKGLEVDAMPHIFTPFYKNISTSEGSGIGLSIVENLVVNGLKGQITCKSELGKGTTFEIEIPKIQ
jgi:signal transduction histidine kinase